MATGSTFSTSLVVLRALLEEFSLLQRLRKNLWENATQAAYELADTYQDRLHQLHDRLVAEGVFDKHGLITRSAHLEGLAKE